MDSPAPLFRNFAPTLGANTVARPHGPPGGYGLVGQRPSEDTPISALLSPPGCRSSTTCTVGCGNVSAVNGARSDHRTDQKWAMNGARSEGDSNL